MGGYGADQGMGPGMMSGYGPSRGMGPGMMGGYGVLSALNLTAEQRKNLEAIQDATRKKQWEVTGKMLDESSKLRDVLAADPLDRVATDAQHERLQALHKERFDIALDGLKKIMYALTAEQGEQLRHYGSWGDAGRWRTMFAAFVASAAAALPACSRQRNQDDRECTAVASRSARAVGDKRSDVRT